MYGTNYNGIWGWREVFFDSETAMYVDRNGQANYYFAVEDNGSSFRLSTSSRNPTFGDYAGVGLYVGPKKNSNSKVVSPFVDEDEAYVDWALVTEESYNSLASEMEIYSKAQELKVIIDKIKAINGDASSLEAVYLNESSSLAQIEQAISNSAEIYDQARTAYAMSLINNATDDSKIDITIILDNPDFEDGEKGWTVTAASGSGANGRQGNVRPGGSSTNQCYEAWNNSAFDIYQTLTDMPVGVYEIEVQGFYRYGRGETAWNAYLAQNVDYVKPEGVPVYVYLNNNATNFVNVYGDDKQITNSAFYSDAPGDYSSHSNGGTTYYFPNGMASAAIAFSDGMYKQSAYGLIANEGDPFHIGVKGNSNQLNDSWVIWDNFKLYYRGFEPEVVKPILETAITDLYQYANMLMGKTEYSTLSKAFTDAQTAINNNDGKAMFAALNDLYNVKDAVIASKDLFLEREVATYLSNLQTAISNKANSKMSNATRGAANALAEGIAGNTIYEGTEIDQLIDDVVAAISSLDNSIWQYSQLNTAIESLTSAKSAKALQSLITEANELLTAAQTGYDNSTFTDSEAATQVETLNAKTAAINLSAGKYAALNDAIGLLAADIAEASQETARVAKSTLTKANLRLTASQKVYDEATTGNDDIDARVTSITELREELMHSINLYKEFKTSLDALATALAKEDKMSAATKATAQEVYNTAFEAYEEGTVDDDQIEAQKNALNDQITAINNSISQYAKLAQAYPKLEAVINLKALQTLVDEANTLYTTASTGYAEGTVADADIDGMISDINTIIPQVQASAEKYADLKEAITRLEDAIALATTDEARVAKSTLKKANLRLTATQKLYNEGTIADEEINARVETIDQLIDELTHSILLYQQFGKSLQDLLAALSTEEKMSAATRTAAQEAYDTGLAAYNDGSIDDDQVEEQIAILTGHITAINTSVAKYASIATALPTLQAVVGLKAMQTLMDEASELYTSTSEDYEACSIADADADGIVSHINTLVPQVQASAALYDQLDEAITNLQEAVNTASAEGVRLSKSTLTKANLRLEASQKAYDEGSIVDADIADRITALNQLIADIDHSIELYRQFKAGLAALKSDLDKDVKLSAATKAAAQNVYDTAFADYEEGNIDDNNIAAQISALASQQTNLANSAKLYADLLEAYPALEEVINLKAYKPLVDEANALYTTASTGYEDGSIADDDVNPLIASINAIIPKVQASAALYEQFNDALAALKTDLDKDVKLAAATKTAAQNVYDTALAAYNEGSVADEDIAEQITTLEAQQTALATSAALYEQLAAAIAVYDTDVADANGQVSAAMLNKAQSLQSNVKNGYHNGTIIDEKVNTYITYIQNAGANLRAAFGLQAKADAVNATLTSTQNSLTQIGTALTQALADIEDCYIASEDKAAISERLTEFTATHGTLSTDADALATRYNTDNTLLTTVTDNLWKNYTTKLTAAGTDLDGIAAALTPMQPDIDEMLAYLAVEPAQSIAASANIIELTAQYGTFCSTANLDFTDVDGLRAYIVSTYLPDGNKVVMTRVNVVPAGTGIVVVGTPGGRYEIPKTNAVSVTSNMLVGTTRRITLEKTVGDKTNCILASGQSGIGFYPTSGGELAPAKAYLPLPTAILEQATQTYTKGVKIVFEDATRLEEVRSAELDGTWYSVGGQKLSKKPSQSGVYVKDGRKVVVK